MHLFTGPEPEEVIWPLEQNLTNRMLVHTFREQPMLSKEFILESLTIISHLYKCQLEITKKRKEWLSER